MNNYDSIMVSFAKLRYCTGQLKGDGDLAYLLRINFGTYTFYVQIISL